MSYGEGSSGAVSFRIAKPAASSSSASTSSRAQPIASTSTNSSSNYHRTQHSRHHRPHQRYESDSEDSEDENGRGLQRRRAKDENITGIDDRGIKYVTKDKSFLKSLLSADLTHDRLSSSIKKERPLVIQSAPNKDFRRAAIELRAKKEGRQQYLPGQDNGEGKAKRVLTDAERRFLESGSNVERTGDKVVVGGIRQSRSAMTNGGHYEDDVDMDAGDRTPIMHSNEADTRPDHDSKLPTEDADALALRELLQDKGDEDEHQTKVHVIPQVESTVTEEEAYAIDVASRPDTPDLEAYQRVPIEDFGAALLRGMGGGNKKPRPKVEAWVPKARTALLGIGAKSREETFGKDWVAQQDGAKKGSNKREQMRFMPLQKVERAPSSGSASPAPRVLGNGSSEQGSSSRAREQDDEDSISKDADRRHRKHRRRSYDSEDDRNDRDKDRDSKRRERSRSPRSDRRDKDYYRSSEGRHRRDDSDRHRYRDEKDRYREKDRSKEYDRERRR